MKKPSFHPCGNFRESYAEELAVFDTWFGRVSLLVFLLLLFGLAPFILDRYLLYILNNIGIMAIAAIGLNILIGYTGQISLGHGAFFGVGAYAGAILATRLNLPFFVCIPAAGLITAMVGMIFGIPSGRLKGLYLTIATLAGQFIIEYVLIQWESLTKGTMGITLPEPNILGVNIAGDKAFFFLIFACLVAMTWFAVNIMRSKFGRAFVAIRDNDRAAEGMGIPIFRYKLLSFAISSFYAGFAGALWAYYMVSITTEPFNLALSVEFIAMVIIGGMGSMPGAIFGATFITVLNEVLRFATGALMNVGWIAGLGLNMAPLREFVFGLAIVLFILLEPKGLAELWRIVRSSFRLWPFSY
ncbi:MAG TPA: branched-chain amino acid ABC transporter permease [Smithellaceae bacterium]|jgi:branched-chain amino acid transport system permease protein|nr:branched-chain amino acid ABC transporter permease [Smithellaceae bacterium]HPO21578.1 branched-chain amino acid ABC transporter permease [Smithellaceae bacterium]HQP05754.1 branched-chain amino acid ABC transporter permease [Smithellaceae bacterium]